MRTLPRFRSITVALQFVALGLAILAAVHFSAHEHAGALIAAAPLILGPGRSFGRTYDNLKAIIKPASADQPESIPSVLFDRQPYLAAGSASLVFFKNATAANAGDNTLSNFANGMLDAGYYFEIQRVFMIIDSVPATAASTAVAGPANDVELLHKTARGVAKLTLKGKDYPIGPIAFLGRPGGPVPMIAVFANAANANIQTGNTENNGGFPILSNVIIPPATQFSATLQFNSTPISAQTNICVALMGILHRPVA